MQPLMYQITDVTCWNASIINGIMLLRWRKTEDPERSLLAPMEERLLRALTSQYTEFGANRKGIARDWDSDIEFQYYASVMRALGEIAELEFEIYRKGDVEEKIKNMQFGNKRVAVCNIENGTHAILLHGRKDGWIECFDPFWDNVKKEEDSKNIRVIPGGSPTNLMIDQGYFSSTSPKSRRLGRSYRFLTIIKTP